MCSSDLVLGDKKNLFPDMIETLRSTEVLSKEGFKVMVYCSDDPLMAKRLEDSGAVAIMPLAAPIGSGLGIQNRLNIEIILSNAKVPISLFAHEVAAFSSISNSPGISPCLQIMSTPDSCLFLSVILSLFSK